MAKQQYIDQLLNSMFQLRKLLKAQVQENQEEKMATMMQFSALKFISNNQNSTVGDLANSLSLSKSSATQLVERLVKMDFVDRTTDLQDRRIVHLDITENGTQEIEQLKKKFREKIGKILSRIPDKDLQELIRIQTELIESLRQDQ